ncbi:MAG: glutathione S-transferase family protein [Maritimibacter harenae]|uniref:Glutathione S-transferase n=1 Tax=Maritimibacter harenae TaxID=2606218 RepID=A0A845M6T4_9RHOB|nr:glutathione S-transferase family protein [Maritimibacter harenae]MZR15306.1 glutathione S-transferase [Maritimibacter harenae]
MQLVGNAASPFVRKVRVMLLETEQDDEVEMIETVTTPVTPSAEASAANPMKKVPALIRPDGCTLYDSRVITRFLDARADAGLYKERRIWEVLTLEATADGIMDAAVLMVYEGRVRPEEKRYDVWVDAQWSKIEGALDALVARWMSHLAGPIDAGQIAIGCALGYLDFRHGDRDWRTGRAELASWYEAFSQRPSMAATAPAG